MPSPGDHLLWLSRDGIVYLLNVRDGRYAGLSGPDAERWVRAFGTARTSRPARPAPLPRWRHLPRRALAWYVNRHVRTLLAARDFHALHTLAAGLPVNDVRRGPAASALNIFLQAELFFKSANPDRDCLVRSFSLYLYLRLLGFPATHRIGIVPYPFDAHAWVELDGQAVLERSPSMPRWHIISQLGGPHDEHLATP